MTSFFFLLSLSSPSMISDVMGFLVSCWVQILDVFVNGGYVFFAMIMLPVLRLLFRAVRSIISR